MNLPEYSLRSAKVIWFFLFVLLAGGALGFATLGKKEDSAFVIKIASMGLLLSRGYAAAGRRTRHRAYRTRGAVDAPRA